jgi:hypothetical protein
MWRVFSLLHRFILGCVLILTAWLVFTLLNLPWIAFVAAFSWKASAVAVVIVGGLTCLIIVFLPEWGMIKLLHGQVPRTFGLRNSYELAHRDAGVSSKRRPHLMTYPDPVPNVFVVRSPLGSGMIILSEGLISLLDEAEIRFVLMRAIRHLHSAEIFVQSGCILILMFLQERVPFRTQSITPIDALRHWLIFPWARAFRKIAESSVTKRVASDYGSDEFIRGASKISRAERLYGQQALLPGLVYLGLQR